MNETIQEVREYFRRRYSYVHLETLSDTIIECFLQEPYIKAIDGEDAFERKMDLLYDHVVSQSLTEVDE